MMILSLAWRNIWRNKVRSVVVMTAIILGITAALVLDAFMLGMVNSFISDSINKTTAHIQIHKKAFLEDEDVKEFISNPLEVLQALDGMDEVLASSSRIIINAMLATSKTSRSIKVKGIDPDREKTISDLEPYILEGEYLEAGSKNKILISTLLAEKIGAKLGSRIVLTFQDMLGEITSGLFRVSGLFDTGNNMVDESTVFVTKDQIIKIIFPGVNDPPIMGHEIAILLKDINQVDTVAFQLNESWPGLSAQTYREIAPELNLYESQIDMMTWFYFIIIMAALIFGIINTMLMAVLERYREFGVLMSLGMARIKVFLLVVVETFVLCFTAAPIGILLGFLIIYYLGQSGVDLTMWSEFLDEFGMSSMVYPKYNPSSFRRLVFAIALTSILAAIYPAWKAIKLNPLEAIRKI